jgi:hypothetical protein
MATTTEQFCGHTLGGDSHNNANTLAAPLQDVKAAAL